MGFVLFIGDWVDQGGNLTSKTPSMLNQPFRPLISMSILFMLGPSRGVRIVARIYQGIPPACPVKMVAIPPTCTSLADSSMKIAAAPSPSWMALGHRTAKTTFIPDRSVSPNLTSITSIPMMASHLP